MSDWKKNSKSVNINKAKIAQVAEWSIASDCKSDGLTASGGSNPPLRTYVNISGKFNKAAVRELQKNQLLDAEK